MAWVAVGAAALSIGGSYLSSRAQKKAGQQAADAQTQSAELGIEEQRRQFDAMQQILSPYVNAGKGAMGAQQDMLGLNGAGAQQGVMDSLSSSPQFTSMMQQGENAMLQNASATGGLRGGNTQDALMQMRPQLLNQLFDQQYARLGGMTQIGQASAAGVGAAGMQTGNNVTQLLGQQGSAQAGAYLNNGAANQQMINGVTQAFGNFMGKKF